MIFRETSETTEFRALGLSKWYASKIRQSTKRSDSLYNQTSNRSDSLCNDEPGQLVTSGVLFQSTKRSDSLCNLLHADMAEVPIVQSVADGRIDLAERQKQNRSSRVANARNAFGNHNCRDIIASAFGVAGMSSCPGRSSGASTAGIISRRSPRVAGTNTRRLSQKGRRDQSSNNLGSLLRATGGRTSMPTRRIHQHASH